MNWEAIHLSESAKELLNRAGVKPFSKAETLQGILLWFTALPTEVQIEIVQDYRAQASRAGSTTPQQPCARKPTADRATPE